MTVKNLRCPMFLDTAMPPDVITEFLLATVPGIDVTHQILLRAMPTQRDVVLSILIAVAAGAVASLALSADPHIVDTPLAQIIANEIQNRTSCRSEVTIEMIPAQTYSTL